jgi:hypothetical protein
MEPFMLWPTEYNKQSMEEGWLLTNDSDGRVTIARLDDPAAVVPAIGFEEPKFATDQAANDFVSAKAKAGSHCHFLACWLQGYRCNDELQVQPPSGNVPVEEPPPPKMRTVELAVAWDGGQWDSHLIEIPDDTDESYVHEVAERKFLDTCAGTPTVVFTYIYNEDVEVEENDPE